MGLNRVPKAAPASADFVPEIVQVTSDEGDWLTPAKIIEKMRERGYPVSATTARDIGIYLSSIGVKSDRRRINGQKMTVYLGVILL